MKPHYRKKDFPVSQIRRFLEPGPVVLVSSAWKGKANLMTLGWHTVMEFTPSLVGCIIASSNHSFELIRRSKQCVINLPTAAQVAAPLVKECYANFECRVVDTKLVPRYNFFILEVVKAHVAVSPKHPQTLHYRGEGIFMVSGKSVSLRKGFRAGML